MKTQHEPDSAPLTSKTYSVHETNALDTGQDTEQDAIQEQETGQETSQTNHDNRHAQTAIIKLKRQGRVMWKLNLVATFLTLLAGVEALFFFDMRVLFSPYFVTLLFGILSAIFLVPWWRQRRTRQSLQQIDDVGLIGPLAEALDAEVAIKPKALIAALRRLLPRLQASDAALLTGEQRKCLYRALRWRAERAQSFYDRGLALDILKALEQIGDKDALPHVQYVAKWSLDKELREAANNCLPFLHQKAEEYRRGEIYLRPSSAPVTTSDILLRPASGANPSHPPTEQLLRPDEQDRLR